MLGKDPLALPCSGKSAVQVCKKAMNNYLNHFLIYQTTTIILMDSTADQELTQVSVSLTDGDWHQLDGKEESY